MYLLIVTGMSGAGKSTALKSLEGLGYYCVDNLPSSMLLDFQTLCERANPPIRAAAVTVDGRESLLNTGFQQAIQEIDRLTCPHEVLFLDARDEVLMERYNELRRRHPLGESGEAESGVRLEREYLQELRSRADYIMDTSGVKARRFPALLKKLLPEMGSPVTSLVLCSFGYKRGVPVDADLVFDMRFVENPYYVPELRLMSGLDKPVAEVIEKQPFVAEFLDSVTGLILKTLPLYEKQEKSILRIAFGCTGGRHRSVYAAEGCARRLREAGIPVRLYHRDFHEEQEELESRVRPL